MKATKFLLVGVCIILLTSVSWANDEEKKEDDTFKSYCPKTLISGQDQCLKCHVPGNFQVKETNINDLYAYPNTKTKIMHTKEGRKGYFFLDEIESSPVQEFFTYMTKQDIDYIILDIHSPGGSYFCGMRIVGIIQDWESAKEGRIVETRCNGFAASAGFLVFVAGTKGHRFASNTTQLMWHQLYSFSMMKITTPASSEEETRVLKHLQNTADEYIESRGKLSKDEIHEKVKNKEFWITGRQALEYGFVDKLLGGK